MAMKSDRLKLTLLIAIFAASASSEAAEIIAHRGANHLAPEATLKAYQRAELFRPDYLEIDIHRTSDGELVIIHDDTLDRTTDVRTIFPDKPSYEVGAFSSDDLITKLDAGSWFNSQFKGQRILKLDEFMYRFGAKNKVYIEFKSPEKYPGIERETVELLSCLGFLHKAVFQSFDPLSVSRVKGFAPDNKAALLIGSFSPTWQAQLEIAKKSGADIVAPRANLFGVKPLEIPGAIFRWRKFISQAKAMGFKVHPYVLNDVEQAKLFIWLGVDGYFTDRIDLLSQQR